VHSPSIYIMATPEGSLTSPFIPPATDFHDSSVYDTVQQAAASENLDQLKQQLSTFRRKRTVAYNAVKEIRGQIEAKEEDATPEELSKLLSLTETWEDANLAVKVLEDVEENHEHLAVFGTAIARSSRLVSAEPAPVRHEELSTRARQVQEGEQADLEQQDLFLSPLSQQEGQQSRQQGAASATSIGVPSAATGAPVAPMQQNVFSITTQAPSIVPGTRYPFQGVAPPGIQGVAPPGLGTAQSHGLGISPRAAAPAASVQETNVAPTLASSAVRSAPAITVQSIGKVELPTLSDKFDLQSHLSTCEFILAEAGAGSYNGDVFIPGPAMRYNVVNKLLTSLKPVAEVHTLAVATANQQRYDWSAIKAVLLATFAKRENLIISLRQSIQDLKYSSVNGGRVPCG
ncbi:hypothetical protein FOZ63_010730, partial [Perkinsus olseni]